VATASQGITAATGGSVATTLNGETVTVNVPAGALSTSTTVALTVYAESGLPRQFASRERRTVGERRIDALPTGATFIVGMALSIGSASLRAPLSFSVTNASTSRAGYVVRLAASQTGSFNDVDTATQSGTSIQESENRAYAGVSLAKPSILYAFYRVPIAQASAAPGVTLTVAGPTSVVGGKTATYSASEIDANGFPFLNPSIVLGVGSTALGTIDSATGVFTATTANNVVGQIIGVDRHTPSISGSLAITVLSSRPANAGDAIAYAGTVTSTISNDAIASSPVVTTQSGTVAQTVNVSSSGAGQAVLVASEADNFQLSTLTTTTTSTIAFQTSGASSAVRLLKSSATDSNNATYATQYTPTSGLLTREPEVPGTFGPNDASQTYAETDPGINVGASGQRVTTVRTTASDGSYNETTTNDDGSTNVVLANADGSGVYTVEALIQYVFGAAQTKARNIPITIDLEQNNAAVSTQHVQAPVWYSLPLSLYGESDTIATVHAYDPRCNVPAKYGTTASEVQQTIVSTDPIYGNLENQTTTAYDVVGVGTVCSIFSDSTQTFYDYTNQEGALLDIAASATSPVLTTTATEILSITGGTISGQPVSTQSRERSATTISHLAVLVGRERFRHALREARIARALRFAHSVHRTKGLR
jgi:hypothetical protein